MKDPSTGSAPDLKTEIGALLRQISNSQNQTVLISSEELFSIKANHIDTMAKELNGIDIQLIAFIRRQDDAFLSNYNQIIKNSNNRPIPSLQNAVERANKMFGDLHYYRHLNNWAGAFGADNMRVIPFEKGDVVESFLDVIGIPLPDTVKHPVRINQSISIKAMHLMRLVNHVTDDVDKRKKLLAVATENWPADENKVGLDPSEQRKILEMFSQQNDKLFKKFGLGRNIYNDYSEIIDETKKANGRLRAVDIAELLVKIV